MEWNKTSDYIIWVFCYNFKLIQMSLIMPYVQVIMNFNFKSTILDMW